MITSNQITPGMVISLKNNLYRVESCVKVTVGKRNAFIKTKLKNLTTNKVSEKNFKLKQTVEDVSLKESALEFLYPEGKNYLFLDVHLFENICIPSEIVGDKVNYLKEGIQVKALGYKGNVFSIELPQFLELVVVSSEEVKEDLLVTDTLKKVVLETGAVIETPVFIENGDIIKIDTHTNEYIQRI